jgi:hypothetical protein
MDTTEGEHRRIEGIEWMPGMGQDTKANLWMGENMALEIIKITITMTMTMIQLLPAEVSSTLKMSNLLPYVMCV